MDPVLDLVLRAGLALLLAAAATHKLRDRRAFGDALAAYRLLPAAAVGPAAVVLALAEAAAAAALVLPATRVAGLTGAAALLGLYAAAVGINLARGRRHIDCGCLGAGGGRRIHAGIVLRNVALAAVALAGLAPVPARPLVWLDALTAIAATLSLAMLWAAADRLRAAEGRA